jgi:endonuclease YncB( thermonuclease family)
MKRLPVQTPAMARRFLLSVLALTALAWPAGVAAQSVSASVLSIGDGDTIRVRQGGRALTVRLACIDAPELSQRPGGARAKAALQALVPPGSSVSLKVQTTDRYGRTVAEVFRQSDPQPVNQTLVRQGDAFVYGRYLQQCDGLAYNAAERAARSQQLGVWGQGASDGSGLGENFLRPWDYRTCKRNKSCS